MGFLDTLKNLFGGAKAKAEAAVGHVGHNHDHSGHGHAGHDHGGHATHDHAEHADHDHDHDHDDHGGHGGALDLAGFDPGDEDTFFNAVLHMDSDGMYGGTDESRAEIMSRFGIRDRSHWQTVRDSVMTVMAQTHGSIEEVAQRQMNWRMGQMQRQQQANTAGAAAKGELNPVEGVTLEKWAAMNAAIAGGASAEDILKANGIDQGRWQRVSGEWNARMSRDTTFSITTVYGNAFQAASQGKYGDYAREATAARAANRELAMEPPVTVEQYWRILYEQDYGSKQGQDPIAVLKAQGLTVVDWTDLSAFMGYYLNRSVVRNWQQFNDMHERIKAEFAAKYPGVQTDVDISF
ncbi:MAG: hypothetical protein R3B06_28415 [Kofleriaceae bacterium]